MAASTGVHQLLPEHGYLFERHSIAGKSLPAAQLAFRIEGALFFGAADSLEDVLAKSASAQVVILQLHRLVLLDTTGLVALSTLRDHLAAMDKTLILCGAGGKLRECWSSRMWRSTSVNAMCSRIWPLRLRVLRNC